MMNWMLYFEFEHNKLKSFVEALQKANFKIEIKIDGKPATIENLTSVDKVDNVEIEHAGTSSFVYSNKPQTRVLCIDFYTDVDVPITKEDLKRIQLADKTLNPFEFHMVAEACGPNPIYRGPWNYDFFMKRLLPIINYEEPFECDKPIDYEN